eukprot:68341-Chlamydomonas_euryale.AAC.2
MRQHPQSCRGRRALCVRGGGSRRAGNGGARPPATATPFLRDGVAVVAQSRRRMCQERIALIPSPPPHTQSLGTVAVCLLVQQGPFTGLVQPLAHSSCTQLCENFSFGQEGGPMGKKAVGGGIAHKLMHTHCEW